MALQKQIIIIVILLSSLNVFAQKDDYIRLWEQYQPLCSHAISLYNDSTFLYDAGCEQYISVSCGNWKMREDTIFINEERLKQNVRSVLKEIDPSNDSTIVLLILDKNNQPVHKFNAVGFPNEIHHSFFQSFYSIVDVQFSTGFPVSATFSTRESDKNGYIEFPIRHIDKIKLLSLVLFDEDFVIDVKNFNRITVKINTNPKIFNYPLVFTEWMEEYPDKIVIEDGRTYYLKVKKE